ncbi:hypothetical protein ACFOJF_14745 [Pseudocitrobacter faecalis]
MLHLEIYTNATSSGRLTDRNRVPYQRRSDVTDPAPIWMYGKIICPPPDAHGINKMFKKLILYLTLISSNFVVCLAADSEKILSEELVVNNFDIDEIAGLPHPVCTLSLAQKMTILFIIMLRAVSVQREEKVARIQPSSN